MFVKNLAVALLLSATSIGLFYNSVLRKSDSVVTFSTSEAAPESIRDLLAMEEVLNLFEGVDITTPDSVLVLSEAIKDTGGSRGRLPITIGKIDAASCTLDLIRREHADQKTSKGTCEGDILRVPQISGQTVGVLRLTNEQVSSCDREAIAAEFSESDELLLFADSRHLPEKCDLSFSAIVAEPGLNAAQRVNLKVKRARLASIWLTVQKGDPKSLLMRRLAQALVAQEPKFAF